MAGIAWETGVLLGLADAGLDLTDADLLVGTSAGSVVATQVATGQALADLHERQLASHTHERTVEFDVEAMIARFVELLADRPHPEELRRRIGEWALAGRHRARGRAPGDHRLAAPGEGVAATGAAHHRGRRRHRASSWSSTATSGVGLVDAVAASCAVPGVWPPVTIGDRRYIDGGVRSTINADLAEGHDQVVVLTPVHRRPRRRRRPRVRRAARRRGRGSPSWSPTSAASPPSAPTRSTPPPAPRRPRRAGPRPPRSSTPSPRCGDERAPAVTPADARRRLRDSLGALSRITGSARLDRRVSARSGVPIGFAAFAVLGRVVADGPIAPERPRRQRPHAARPRSPARSRPSRPRATSSAGPIRPTAAPRWSRRPPPVGPPTPTSTRPTTGSCPSSWPTGRRRSCGSSSTGWSG